MDNREFKVKLEERTLQFAINIVRFCGYLPKNSMTEILIRQLLKSGTSIGANYREANRAESKKDFIHKIGIVEKEASETEYWLELLKRTELLTNARDLSTLQLLFSESRELLALFNSISRNSKN